LALFFGLLALARPQWGTHEEVVKVSGLDIMVALDVSNSMETEDMAPSRLKKAKHVVRSVLERLRGDRAGAVAFAGSSYLACPLTTDLEYVGETLDHLGPRSILNQGTDIGIGLETALKALERGAEEGVAGEGAKTSSQVILLISDGEDHQEGASEIARKLRASGIKLFVLGIGTEKGGPIPSRDEHGNLHGYKKNRKGEAVLSSFRPNALMKITADDGGKYWTITAGETETEEVLHEMKALNRTDFSERRYVVYEDRFQYPLALAVLLLFLELAVPLRLPAGKRKEALSAILSLLLTGCGEGGLDRLAMPFKWYSDTRKGVEEYKEGRIEDAKKTFGSVQARNPDSPELRYNQSLVQNHEGEAENAMKGFGEAAKAAERADPGLAAKSYYNLGNVLAKKSEMKGAVEAYLSAIEAARRAKDDGLERDARKNLELLLQQIQKQNQQKQQEEQQQKEDQKEDKKKENQLKPVRNHAEATKSCGGRKSRSAKIKKVFG
jgi:Ca-activated chloride channel family protein